MAFIPNIYHSFDTYITNHGGRGGQALVFSPFSNIIQPLKWQLIHSSIQHTRYQMWKQFVLCNEAAA